MKTKLIFSTLALVILIFAFAIPDRTLTGTVITPDGQPLIGATVIVQDTDQATITDYEGQFSLPISDRPITLVVSYIGFQKQTVNISTSQTNVRIQMVSNPVDRTLTGTVLDEADNPLHGVTVQLFGYGRSTTTNPEGAFELLIPAEDAVLVFAYPGKTRSSITVKPEETTVLFKFEDPQPAALTKEEAFMRGLTDKDVAPSVEEEVVFVDMAADEATSIVRTGTPPSPPPPPPPPSTSEAKPVEFSLDRVVVKGDKMKKTSAMMSLSGAVDAYEVPAMEEVSKLVMDDYVPTSSGPAAKAGSLTAGEVNDFMKWELWQDISEEDLAQHKEAWQILPKERYTVQLQTRQGNPIADCTVKLLARNGGVLWKARTDNTGKAELWSNLFFGQQDVVGKIVSDCDGIVQRIDSPKKFQDGINIQHFDFGCELPNKVDIVFAVDATGSMQDEINYLKAELNDVINRIKDTLPDIDLRLGSVFYRDHTDDYLTRTSPLSADISQTTKFIEQQNAGGGGDHPEAVEAALDKAINHMEWSTNAVARIVFLVLDAPPHNNPEIQQYLRQLSIKAAQKGVRIVPVACSGTNKPMEYLMRSLSLATNGSYIFLTDDSGIGLSHIEPTTDDYKVEKLNGLLQRVIYQFAFTPSCDEPLYQAVDIPSDTAVIAQNLPNQNGTETPGSINWKYYPNPSYGQITVEVEGDIDYLYLTDVSGKVLQRIVLNGQQMVEIDLSNYPDGLYNLRYEYAKDRWMNGKVVLARA